MTFLWPELLWSLAAVPLLIALYVWVLRRKRRLALRYASLSMVRDAMSTSYRIRRHVPPLLFLVALTAMLVAMARPAAVITLPSRHEIVMLAMDVSGSMRAADVKPSRIEAAQAAAKGFIADQPSSARIGIVSFAATASIVQQPTQNREDLTAAIDRFQLQKGTNIGGGILMSLKALFPDIDFEALRKDRRDARDARRKAPDDPVPDKDKAATAKAEPGSYPNAAIVLLTDGETTTGPDPLEAARIAADRGVRVFTVGVGTTRGEVIGAEGWSMRVKLDEQTLKQVANLTRGEYFYAGSAPELKKVYDTLNTKLVMEKKQTEITAIFAAVATVLAVIAAFLSLMWFNRLL
ncbi:MAG TPA: VWA domain-containing protein [Casimicrobiaceae bacterium]|nr:VWA domain-containing protein [Casimicrobiaceae bacterium]